MHPILFENGSVSNNSRVKLSRDSPSQHLPRLIFVSYHNQRVSNAVIECSWMCCRIAGRQGDRWYVIVLVDLWPWMSKLRFTLFYMVFLISVSSLLSNIVQTQWVSLVTKQTRWPKRPLLRLAATPAWSSLRHSVLIRPSKNARVVLKEHYLRVSRMVWYGNFEWSHPATLSSMNRIDVYEPLYRIIR